MRIFNSFQIVAAFMGWPWLISWLSDAVFRGSSVAFYSSCTMYLVAMICMIGCVANSLGKGDWF